MTMPADTCPLSDAEILHLLRTLAPGIPPGLDHPPLPPATLTPPPWAARPPTTRLGPWIALAGALALLIVWGIAHDGNRSTLPGEPAVYATVAPGALYLVDIPATATVVSDSSPPRATATAPPPPTVPPTLPALVPTAAPPTLPPATATMVRVAPPPAQHPHPRAPVNTVPPTWTALPPSPTSPPTPPSITPPAAGGSGAWGNDWLDPAIQAREATALAARTPEAP